MPAMAGREFLGGDRGHGSRAPGSYRYGFGSMMSNYLGWLGYGGHRLGQH